MKKLRVFLTILIVLCCIALPAALYFTVTNLLEFTKTSHEIADIEQKKIDAAAQVSENYQNPNPKHNRANITNTDSIDYKHIYMMDDTAFVSNTDTWDEVKLEELSLELLKNKHGEEIEYVSKVVLLGEGMELWAGFQETSFESYGIPIALYSIVPSDTVFQMHTDLSIITLLDADLRTTVEDMAPILSHEYGHHFTEYYFGITYTPSDKYTEYCKLRCKDDDRIIFDHGEPDEYYYTTHMWHFCEIGAEDYAFLMGSPTGRQVVDFYDDFQQLRQYASSPSRYDDTNYSYKPSLNGTPHENTVLPMPCEVEGLAEYFYSFIDEEPPIYSTIEPIGDLNLYTTKLANMSYKIRWDKPFEDEDVVYTLLACDESENIGFMVKSLHGDEEVSALLGSFQYQKNGWLFTHTAGIEADTTILFKVSITFPDGTVVISDPVEMIFE